MTVVSTVQSGLSLLTMGTHLTLLAIAILVFIKWVSKSEMLFLRNAAEFVKRKYLILSFIVAWVATLGSLFFSEIALYEPCKLCWFQRIFMYPLVPILGVALWKKDQAVARYVIALSGIGIIFSGYHYGLSISSKISSSGVCSVGGGPSCVVEYVMEYGYVTIPLMALTAFALLILLAVFVLRKKTIEPENNN